MPTLKYQHELLKSGPRFPPLCVYCARPAETSRTVRYKLYKSEYKAASMLRKSRIEFRKIPRQFQVPYCHQHAREWRIGLVVLWGFVLLAIGLAIGTALFVSVAIVGDSHIYDSSDKYGFELGYSAFLVIPLVFFTVGLFTWLAKLTLARIFETFRDFDFFAWVYDVFVEEKNRHLPGFDWIWKNDVFTVANEKVGKEFASLNSLSLPEDA